MLGSVNLYYIQYGYMKYTHNCQIEAASVEQCREIFKRNFEAHYKIIKIKTGKEISEEIAKKVVSAAFKTKDKL